MSAVHSPRSWPGTLRVYGAALALCLVILTVTLKLWRADLHVPFNYANDSLYAQLWIKGIAENGWYLHHGRLGAPHGADLHDFPLADNVHFGLLWLLTRFTSDTGYVFNLFCLLSFPLVLVTSLAVFRQLRIADWLAMVLALLYTFLPYHFLRGLSGHIFLMSYFMIPPAVLLALWICLDCRISPHSDDEKETRVVFTKRRGLVAALVCVLTASTGIYYAFFGCFLLCIAGLYCAGQQHWRGCRIAAVLVVTLLLGIGANLLPTVVYQWRHGPNPEAVVRDVQAAEIYGMRITQLLLPMSMHRLRWLGQYKLLYCTAIPWGSSDYGYLGAVGAAGFVFLLGRFVFKRVMMPDNRILDVLQIANLFTVLLATAGGFGMIGSLYAGAWLRCFERMSIVIAFLSILAVGLVLNALFERRAWLVRSAGRRVLFLGGLLFIGVFEQTCARFVPPYDALREEYTHDASFIARIEAALPERATIFQLPYMPFPESGPVCRIGDYDPVRGYLHSRSLRWSYGAMKGRTGDAWLRSMSKLPPAEMVQALADAGFQGIYIDRFGYEDHAARLEHELSALLDETPLVSADRRLCFFDMTAYSGLRTELSKRGQALADPQRVPVSKDLRTGLGKPVWIDL